MELFTCDNQEAAAEIWSILEANNIEYKMVTNQDTSSLQKNIRYHQIQKTRVIGNKKGMILRLPVHPACKTPGGHPLLRLI